MDRLNDSDDLSTNFNSNEGEYNLETCPLCQDTHSRLQPCNCRTQFTMSTTQKSSHDNSVEFSQEITSDPSFNLPCSLFQSNGHVNGDYDFQQHGIPKRKIRKLSRISLPKKKSKSVQVDLPKGYKNVQVNLSCKTINYSCQTNVPTSNKSSQSISSQQSHCSVQTEKSEEYLDYGEHEISISDFFEMFWEHLKTEKQCDDFIKLA